VKISFPALEWNALVASLIRHAHPIPGDNCRITRESRGTALRPDMRAFRWQHPWQCTAFWDADRKQWRSRIRPGFLDGQDPVIPDGADPKRKAESEPDLPDTDAPILEPGASVNLPLAPWSLRPNRYFERLGVRDPMEGFRAGGGMGVQIVDESWRDALRPEPRQLYRCDIVLSKARPGMSGEVTLLPTASGNAAIFTPSYQTTRLDQVGPRGRITATPLFAPTPPPTLSERLAGDFNEAQEDQLHLATIWLLSPPGDLVSKPGQQWEPHYQHHVFWNLAHTAPLPVIPRIPPPITLGTGLLGGLADSIFNQMLAPGNDAAANISTALNAVSPAGKFHSV